VNNIAAADVSRCTFFRYFPTKEEVVLFDDLDPLFEQVLATLPAGTPMLTALRTAMRTTFSNLDTEKRELEELRMKLARTVPEIAATLRARNAWGIDQMAAVTAGALKRNKTDPEVFMFAGMVTGARLAAQALVEVAPARTYIDALDTVLGRLTEGVPLADAPILTDRHL
jgi:AcrR family transcriptional regulator